MIDIDITATMTTATHEHPTHTDLGWSAWVGRSPSVCLFVCPQLNLKTNDPKALKLGIGMTLGYPRNGVVLGLKG